ncbi:MAG: VWA domain-containing protein, partial [Actinomycetales bacterium]|nr:VWA domain-containing protein [Actinomycetales bacterium]
MPVSERPDLSAICAAFGDALHRAGVPVTPERSARFASAVVLADSQSTSGLYWVGRVTLTTGREQFETFDRVFRQIFRGLIDLSQAGGLEQREEDSGATDAAGVDSPPSVRDPGMEGSAGRDGTSATPGAVSDDSDSGSASALAAVSDVQRLNDREFSTLTAEELALLQRLVEQLPLVPPLRRGRRTRRHRSAGTIDVRSTLRRSHRTGGDPVRLLRRRRTTKPRRIVLIADVSGSMEPYARIYLHLLRGAVRAINAEAFVFATHLTRLTGQLS